MYDLSMSYVVIGYPKLDPKDYDWIQSIRKKYDLRQYSVVKPHVTFIFPTSKLDSKSLIEHVSTKGTVIKAFQVKFDSARVIEDDSKTYFHAFLIPSIGYEEINFLHDILYTGLLKSELRLDIPFIPHLGIANDTDETVMDKLATIINKDSISISGTIDSLSVCEYDGNKVTDLQTIDLVRE